VGYIIVTALVLIICLVAWLVGSSARKQTRPEDQRYGTIMRWSALIVLVLFVGVFTVLKTFHTVPAGSVGVIYQFGNITGQTGAGLVATAPWQGLRTANVQVQRFSFDHLDSFTSETQNVFISATINYQVSPKDVQRLYRTVGPDYFSKLVPNRVNQFFKDETVKYKAVEIAPNRDTMRTNVLARLKTQLAPYSIQVDDLLIDNISFSPQFTSAIEDKQIATQEAQAAKNRVAKAEFQAQQIIATAQGQAKANLLKRQTLTPLLVQQNAIDKLNPNVQVILLPSNSNFLLPSSLLGLK
jgi:prohibitin 1